MCVTTLSVTSNLPLIFSMTLGSSALSYRPELWLTLAGVRYKLSGCNGSVRRVRPHPGMFWIAVFLPIASVITSPAADICPGGLICGSLRRVKQLISPPTQLRGVGVVRRSVSGAPEAHGIAGTEAAGSGDPAVTARGRGGGWHT